MKVVGVRELRLNASEILRQVAEGETFEITDRGRPVAVLVRVAPSGLEQLEKEGMIRRGQGDLLELKPLPLRRGARPPSELVERGRDE